jgi:hypothetical protein
MNTEPVIVFGSDLLAKRWAEENGHDPTRVYLATQPERIQGLWGPFKLVKYPQDVWVPTSYACEQRVKATLDWVAQEEGLRGLREKNEKRAKKK